MVAAELPLFAEEVPNGQFRQAESPSEGPYVPGAQLMHCCAVAAPVVGLYVPKGQDLHTDCPIVSW